MKNETARFPTPVLADAAARTPRKNAKKMRNNYVAEGPAPPAKGPGAPKGNRNARRHGRYSAEFIARRRALREDLRMLRLMHGCTTELRFSAEFDAALLAAMNAVAMRLGREPG